MDMEERGIIRCSTSEYESPLVLVRKKNGDLQVCTNFHWLNRRTLKDAHPLPHQADCLAVLGDSALFSMMDFTSGFYMLLHEDDHKFTSFTTQTGLLEYKSLPKVFATALLALCVCSIMQYFRLFVLYRWSDCLWPKWESCSWRSFGRLRAHGLKLVPKKCHLLRVSVKFLANVINKDGVSTDLDRVECKSKSSALKESDGKTPSQKRIR